MAFHDNRINSLSGLIDVCKRFVVAEFIPYFRDFEFNASVNSIINGIFLCCLIFVFIFYYFNKFFHFFLKSAKVKHYKWKQTVQSSWNFCFYSASAFFLDLYHHYFLEIQILRETGFFPKYENTLFLISDDITKFNTISLILMTFYIMLAILDIKSSDYSAFVGKILYGCVLINFYLLGFENFSVILNIQLGIYYSFTELINLIALHTSSNDKNDALFKIYVFLRFISWSYVYLTLLPFNYLIPTLYAKNFNFFLNVFFWLWYGSCIWNSPLLKYFHHQIFHTNSADCIGGNSVTRCILLKDSQDLRHYNNLQKAVLELKLANERRNLSNPKSTENASATAFQSIKCLMVLKRKLKRIRENKQNEVNIMETDK